MAIVGHWESLTEAQKLVQSKLLKGVVEEVIEEGSLLPELPVMAIDSKSLLYNRESTLPSASFYDIHEQIPWTADVDYTDQVEVILKRVARQDVLDQFMMDTYRDPNDYRTIVLSELRKGCMRTIEDKLIYGDVDNDAAEFDGIFHLFKADAAGGESFDTTGNYPQIYDMGDAALSVQIFRQMLDRVRPKASVVLMSRTIRNLLSAAAFEAGIASTYPAGGISYSKNEYGTRIDFFDGIRLLVSDYMVDEDDHTGDKATSATGIQSICAIRFGQIMDGGLCLCTGGTTGGPEFFKIRELEALEDYDAAGIRLTAYCALALGSNLGAARITSIDREAAVVA